MLVDLEHSVEPALACRLTTLSGFQITKRHLLPLKCITVVRRKTGRGFAETRLI